MATENLADIGLKRVRDNLTSYTEGTHEGFVTLLVELQNTAVALAQDEQYRRNIGEENNGVWTLVRDLWRVAVSETVNSGGHEDSQAALCLRVARFTRNMVAGVPTNQSNVIENESSIRSLIYHYTSYGAIHDPKTYPITRMLVQTLSNLATGNEPIISKLWKTYLALPEEQLILLRLLTSPDAKTVSSTLVFALNCIHSNEVRMEMLVTAPRGPRIMITMLDRISSLVHSMDPDESQAFDVGFEIFTQLVEAGLIPRLYEAISMSGEPITPPQTTLLKLLDSYLHKTSHGLQAIDHNTALIRMLINTFFALSAYAQSAIRRALGSADTPQTDPDAGDHATAPKELDLLLPKVSEALVLVSQCLSTLALSEPDQPTSSATGRVKTTLAMVRSSGDEGLVESLVETLRLLDTFVPRITFGKVVERPSPPGVQPPSADAATRSHPGVEGLSYVKRDLVRLLGIISLDDRGVQDRVRECGGIPVVMNLCVIDDRNPYMKEHAILALRNLLHVNSVSQEVVKEIQPVARWDERGVLQSLS
ncbi:spinocerebellar ataxia type 10 protein domain-containing protein [Fomitopsis betulina]|nr:spinocerebellar ataxia type 10 protein domain-containing protein [Fomitopsis betulina]